MNKLVLSLAILLLLPLACFGQYPFEKYPKPTCNTYNDWKLYDWTEAKQKVNHTITVDSFFNDTTSLTIQLTSFDEDIWNNSEIRIFKGENQIQKLYDDMAFVPSNIFSPIQVVDFNADGLLDVKIVVPYMGNGLASLNCRVIYLIQNRKLSFTKLAFVDKLYEGGRPERDVDGNGSFEVITMQLVGHNNHSYWVFNLYEIVDSGLLNVNHKLDYPILIQYLYRDNYEITKDLSREEMKQYSRELPEGFDQK